MKHCDNVSPYHNTPRYTTHDKYIYLDILLVRSVHRSISNTNLVNFVHVLTIFPDQKITLKIDYVN